MYSLQCTFNFLWALLLRHCWFVGSSLWTWCFHSFHVYGLAELLTFGDPMNMRSWCTYVFVYHMLHVSTFIVMLHGRVLQKCWAHMVSLCRSHWIHWRGYLMFIDNELTCLASGDGMPLSWLTKPLVKLLRRYQGPGCSDIMPSPRRQANSCDLFSWKVTGKLAIWIISCH